MLSKFFKKRPRAGMPLAAVGMANRLADMDHAWATLDVLAGDVSWNHGRPTIVTNGSGIDFDTHGVPDDLSLDNNGVGNDEKLQIFNWDNAATSAEEDFNNQLFPYKDEATDGLLYADGNTLMAWIDAIVSPAPGNLPLDYDSLDLQVSGSYAQLFEWDTAPANNAAAGPLTTASLIPCKRWNGSAFVDDLVYYSMAELLAEVPTDYWVLGSTYATAYGQSIGSDATTKVIDLTTRTLTGGLWNADAGIDVVKNAASEAGRFTDGNSETIIGNGSNAISTDGIIEIDGSNGGGFNTVAGAVYNAGGVAGVTGDGFSGGIKIDDTAMRAAIESQVQDALAGVGGLL